MEENEELWTVVEKPEEDHLIDIIAKQSVGERLSRAEKKVLNKAEWAEKKKSLEKVARQPISVPAGAKQRMREFKEKLLAAHNGNNVIRKILDVAMNDEHPGQMAALKLCADRMMPVSMFDDVKKSNDKPMISINITGVSDSPVIDADVTDVSEY